MEEDEPVGGACDETKPEGVASTTNHPIDRGWAWMIVLAGFVCHFFVSGSMRCTGIYVAYLIELYRTDPSLAATTVALMAGGFALLSPVGNATGQMVSNRAACALGGVFVFLGAFISSIAGNALVIVVCLGLLTGIGFAFVFGPCMVMLSRHFEVRLSLATGLAVSGSSVGTFLIPLLVEYTVEEVGFAGTLLILSGIMLHILPCALLLRPLTAYRRPRRAVGLHSTDCLAGLEEGLNRSRRDLDNSDVQQESECREDTKQLDRDRGGGEKDSPTPSVIHQLNPAHSVTHQLNPAPSVTHQLNPTPAVTHRQNPAPSVTHQLNPAPAVTHRLNPAPAVSHRLNPAPAVSHHKMSMAGAEHTKMTLGIFVRTFCQRLCDPDLLKNCSFYLYVLGIALGQAGYISNMTFLPSYSRERFPTHSFTTVISLIGASDLVGRVGGGWFSDLNLVNKAYILGFSFIGSGFVTALLPLFHSHHALIAYSLLLGLLGGTYQAQLVVILVELYGRDKTSSGLGLTQLVMGLTIIPLPPLLGRLGKSNGYGAVLWICGALMCLAGSLFYALPTANQRATRRSVSLTTTTITTTTTTTTVEQDCKPSV